MMQANRKNFPATHMLVITVVIFATYLAALKAGFLAVDDVDTIKHVQSADISLTGLFLLPGNDYYRPLTYLSLVVDFRLFGGNPVGYHLTNILLHLTNALLVYYLATLFLGQNRNPGIGPLLAALLFAVHPVNSETVVWISARADLLCCFFLILCLIYLVNGYKISAPLLFTELFIAFFCSLASKEASLFLPFLAVLYCCLERKKLPAQKAVTACVALFASALFYLMLRNGLPITSGSTVASGTHPADHALSFVINETAAAGFYVRKLLYPFPLNIAITEIPTTLCLVFFLISFTASALAWRKVPGLRFPLGFLAASLVPPLGLLYLSIPWTPYAERYLYIPSVAFALCVIILLRRYTGRIPQSIIVICLILAAVSTAYRANLWTKPISFWQSAVAMSPRFGTVYLALAAAYLDANRLAEAEQSLRQAKQEGLPTKTALAFSAEIARLIEISSQNLPKLQQSTVKP